MSRPSSIRRSSFELLLTILCPFLALQLCATDLDTKFFPSSANTKSMLADGLAAAQKSNRRLMVIYQGVWCTRCPEVERGLDAANPIPLEAAYVVVRLETKELKPLQAFAQQLEPNLKLTPETGPLITVFDKDGSLLDARDATRFIANGQLSSSKVNGFAQRWAPLPPASQVLEAGLASLRSGGKLGIVQFGADWCKYCHLMDKFFDSSPAASVLARYYVRIPIDYERNEGAPPLAAQLGEQGDEGLPWWVVIDAAGKPLANCRGPHGSIGFPTEEDERAYFLSVVQATAPGISAEELAVIHRSLDEYMTPPSKK